MAKIIVIIATIFVTAIFIGWDMIAQPNQQITVSQEDITPKAPDVAFTTLDGAEISLKEFEGKYILVNFWATWCTPCVREMPDLFKLASAHPNLIFIAASVDRDPAIITPFFDKLSLSTEPNNIIIAHDPKMLASSAYGTLKFPESYIISPEGYIIKKITGITDWFSDDMLNTLKEAK